MIASQRNKSYVIRILQAQFNGAGAITPAPMKQPWSIWINKSHCFHRNTWYKHNQTKHPKTRARVLWLIATQKAKFMGPTWGPPGSCRPQMGPMLAPRTLLSGNSSVLVKYAYDRKFITMWYSIDTIMISFLSNITTHNKNSNFITARWQEQC